MAFETDSKIDTLQFKLGAGVAHAVPLRMVGGRFGALLGVLVELPAPQVGSAGQSGNGNWKHPNALAPSCLHDVPSLAANTPCHHLVINTGGWHCRVIVKRTTVNVVYLNAGQFGFLNGIVL